MPTQYTKGDVINTLHPYLAKEKICNLYSGYLVNQTGKVKGEREFYTETIANQLLMPENLMLLNGIPIVFRKSSYSMNHQREPHDGTQGPSNPSEKTRTKAMKDAQYAGIGTIIDYQTPLKNVRNDGTDRHIGEIDLLSFNEDENCVYMIEYKAPSNETLLRCVLEIHTYWCTVDKAKLLYDFRYPEVALRKAVLIHHGCQAFYDFQLRGTAIRKLMKALYVDFYVLNDDGMAFIEQESCKYETL